MTPEINNVTEMTLEITLKGEKYDCVLRNFFLSGEDLPLHTNMDLDTELVSASDETILAELWEENIFFWTKAYESNSKNKQDEEERELFAALYKALDNLDYNKIKKSLIR